MHKIYFDTNEEIYLRCYALSLPASKDDISRIESELHNGMRVIIRMNAEIEMEANLYFDSIKNFWIAIPDYTTAHDLPAEDGFSKK